MKKKKRSSPPPVATKLNTKGQEENDPTPMALPIGYEYPETLDQKIQRMVRVGLSDHAEQNNRDTFEEANDFEVDDDPYEPTSPHEVELDEEIIGKGVPNVTPKKNPQVPVKVASKSEGGVTGPITKKEPPSVKLGS